MSGVEGSPESRAQGSGQGSAQGSGQGSAQGSLAAPDPGSNQAPGELSSRTRMVILVFAVVVGVLVAAVPVVISLSDAPSKAPSTSSAVGSDAAGGGAQDGAGDGSGSGSTAGSDGGNAGGAAGGAAGAGSSDGGKTGGQTGGQTGVELSGVRLPYLSVAGRQATGDTGAGGASSGGAGSGSTGSAGAGSGGTSPGGQGSDETVDLGEALHGKVSIVNVWAWWCGPCRQELPVLSQAAAKHPEWNVVGVHSAKEAQAGVDFLKELRATDLTTYQDGNHVFDTATNIPKVVPITLVYRADGTRAGLLPRTFHTVEELEQAVQEALGAPEGGGA